MEQCENKESLAHPQSFQLNRKYGDEFGWNDKKYEKYNANIWLCG